MFVLIKEFIRKNKKQTISIIGLVVIIIIILISSNNSKIKKKEKEIELIDTEEIFINEIDEDLEKEINSNNENDDQTLINLKEKKNKIKLDDQSDKIIINNKKIKKENKSKIKNKDKERKNKISQNNNPLELINKLHRGLKKMSTEKSFNENEVTSLIDNVFNIEKMISMIVGKKWESIEDKKKSFLILQFREYVAKNYFKRFSKIKDLKFIDQQTEQIKKNILLVSTTLVVNDGKKVNLNIDYLLSKNQNEWKVFDVLLDGAVSEIATKKSEFRSFIKKNNIDELINALDKINSNILKSKKE